MKVFSPKRHNNKMKGMLEVSDGYIHCWGVTEVMLEVVELGVTLADRSPAVFACGGDHYLRK